MKIFFVGYWEPIVEQEKSKLITNYFFFRTLKLDFGAFVFENAEFNLKFNKSKLLA